MSRDIWGETPSQFDMNNGEYDTEEVLDEEQIQEEVYEDVDTAFDLDKRENFVVSDAMVRLDQARLYEMLIKHDLFDGVEANQYAMANVKKEMKEFIIERLEFLLGIRAKKQQIEEFQGVQQFDEDEARFLKFFAQRGMKGNIVPNAPKSEPKPLQNTPAPKPQGLKTMAPAKPVARLPDRTPVKQATPARKPEQKPTPQKTQIKFQESNKSIDQLAMEDLKNLKGRKKARDMNEEELEKANNEANKRYQKPAAPVNAIQPLDDAGLANVYATREMNKANKRPGTEDLGAVIAQQLLRNR